MERLAPPAIAAALVVLALATSGCGSSAPTGPTTTWGPAPAAPENGTAVVNIMRHGEKQDDNDPGLSTQCEARASYLAACMSSGSVSRALPYGPATAVMAAQVREGKSSRPVDTVRPLAEDLGLTVQMPCDKEDSACFASYLPNVLTDRGAVIVGWMHQNIPDLIKALGLNRRRLSAAPLFVGHNWDAWTDSCPSLTWPEPKVSPGCYDEIWQVAFKGSASGEWVAESVDIFRQGFAGVSGAPCIADLNPDGTETSIAEGGSCQSKNPNLRDSCATGLECKQYPDNYICQQASGSLVV